MTYSRPATGTVSVRGPGDRSPRTQVVDNTGGVRASANARLIDASSAQIAGQNAGQDAAEISKFLENFAPIAKDVGTALLEQRANRQLGQLMAQDPTLGERYRNADPDAQARIDTLNPLTKDLFIRSQMASAARTYQEVFPTLALADSRLTKENALENPEAFASALQDVQSQAEQKSGITNLPAGVRGAMSGDLGIITGAVKGKLFSAQEQNRQSVNATQTGDGLVNQIDFLGDDIAEETKKDGGDAAGLLGEFQRDFAADVLTRTGQGQTTPVRHLASLLGRMAVKLDFYRESGKFEQAEQLLDTLETLSNKDLRLENGLNYWTQSIKVGDQGKTLNVASFISSQRTVTEKAERLEGIKEAEEKALPLAVRVAQGDQTAVIDFQQLLPQIADSPDALKAVLSVFGASQNFGDQLTLKDSDLLQAVYDPNRDRDAVRDRILDGFAQGRYSEATAVRLLNRNLQGQENPNDPNFQAANAGTVASRAGVTAAQASILTQLEQEVARENGITLPSNQQDLNTAFLQGEAFNRTAAQLKTAQEAGTPIPPEQVNQVYLDNLQAIVDERREELSEGSAPRGIPISKYIADDLNAMRQRILEGKRGLEMFTPRLLQSAVAKGINLEAPDALTRVTKLLTSQMSLARDKDGNPEYANPGELLKRMIDDARKEAAPPASNRRSARPQAGGTNYTPPRRPGSSRTRQQQEADQKTNPGGNQSRSFSSQLLEGLQEVAGVVLPGGGSAANAGELPDMTVNDEQIELLAKLWSGREKPTLTTPAAPQVQASAPTKPIPLAIRNDRHEFFVAIGINEGTRTANGGYTKAYFGHRDRGDGNINRGTVSGGRGNTLTPKQVDARWMGVLTDASIKYSGILKRLGLQPSTQGYNRVMFNILDLTVQAPAAVQTFVTKLNRVKSQNWTVEAIAKARADSFYRYDGTLATSFPNYQTLFQDQRSRAGTFDYKKRF